MDGTSQLKLSRPWHDGELRMQRWAGVADRMDIIGHRSIRDDLIESTIAYSIRSYLSSCWAPSMPQATSGPPSAPAVQASCRHPIPNIWM